MLRCIGASFETAHDRNGPVHEARPPANESPLPPRAQRAAPSRAAFLLAVNPAGAGVAAPADASRAPPREQAIASGLASPASPLDAAARVALEHGFGADLGDVRLHVGDAASRSAADLRAAAYTVGKDMVFGAGRYAPEQPRGRQLLAHELAHTLQQTPAAEPPASDADAAAEQEARSAGSQVAAGSTTRPPRRVGPPVLAR